MIDLRTPSEARSYLKDKALLVFPELDLEKGFFRSYEQARKAQKNAADTIFICLSVEGEPQHTPGAPVKNTMLIQLAIMQLVSAKDDFDAQESAKASCYTLAWNMLQNMFQDYASREITSFKIDGSRILELESDDLQSYFGSLLLFRITGIAPHTQPFYNP